MGDALSRKRRTKPLDWVRFKPNKPSKGDETSAFEMKIAKVRRAAPPHFLNAQYRWFERGYRLCCALSKAERKELKRLHKQLGFSAPRTGDKLIRMIIDVTAGDHVTAKLKHRYAVCLGRARSAQVKPKDLRKWIENNGGINGTAK